MMPRLTCRSAPALVISALSNNTYSLFLTTYAKGLLLSDRTGLIPPRSPSRTPRRASARVALHARAVAHQRKVAALAAHLALVAFGFGFGPAFGLGGCGGRRGSRLAPLQRLQLLRRRQIVLGLMLERDRAFNGVGRARGGAVRGQRSNVAGAARIGLWLAGPAHDDEIVGARAGQALRQIFVAGSLRRPAFLDALAHGVEIGLARVHMGQIEAAHVADRKLPEHVVEDR